MVRSLADPDNSPPSRYRQINRPRRPASTKRPGPSVLRHYAFHGCQMTAAAVPDCPEVHRALAEATDPGADPDRRASTRTSGPRPSHPP